MNLDNRLGIVVLVLVAIVGAVMMADSFIPGGIMSLIK